MAAQGQEATQEIMTAQSEPQGEQGTDVIASAGLEPESPDNRATQEAQVADLKQTVLESEGKGAAATEEQAQQQPPQEAAEDGGEIAALKKRLGDQGNEIGELRQQNQEMRSTLDDAMDANRQFKSYIDGLNAGNGGQQNQPADPAQQHWDNVILTRAELFMEQHGMERDAAIRHAATEVHHERRAIDATFEQNAQPLFGALKRFESNEEAGQVATALRTETDTRTGELMRPDWVDVVRTPQFTTIHKGMGEPMDRNGLELAYYKARAAIGPNDGAQAAEEASEAASAEVDAQKAGANLGGAPAPTGEQAPGVDADQAELEEIYRYARGDDEPYAMGGPG